MTDPYIYINVCLFPLYIRISSQTWCYNALCASLPSHAAFVLAAVCRVFLCSRILPTQSQSQWNSSTEPTKTARVSDEQVLLAQSEWKRSSPCPRGDWLSLHPGSTNSQVLKGLCHSYKCLVFIVWSLPWKLRYRPIQCAYLKPLMTHFSDCRRNRIGLEIGN